MSDATDTDTETSTDSAADDTRALPGDGLREGIVDHLRSDLGEHLLDVHLVPQDDLWVRVAPEAWAVTAAALRAQGFHYFCFLSAIDWLPSPFGKSEDDPSAEPEPADDEPAEMTSGYAGGDSRFQVFARVTDIGRHVSVTIKTDVPESMSVPTWIPSYAGANWHERETHEMFGIGFDGHPDLRNIYLPGEFEGFPLRKDFPLLSRLVKPWPGIVDVEPMPEVDDDAPTAAETAAGDAVASATETGDGAASAADADATVEIADAVPPADPSAGEPAAGPVADTIITDDTATDTTAPADPDADRPGADGEVEPDLEPGTVTESTDADAAAPTPGPATEAHPDGLTGGADDTSDEGRQEGSS